MYNKYMIQYTVGVRNYCRVEEVYTQPWVQRTVIRATREEELKINKPDRLPTFLFVLLRKAKGG